MKWVQESVDAPVRPIHAASPFGSEARSTERADDAPISEFQFRQVLNVLRRRGALLGIITGAGVLLAGTIGLLITPKYTAQAQLVVEPVQAYSGAAATADSAEESTIETHVISLNSRSHLQRVLDSFAKDAATEEPTQKAAAMAAPEVVKPALAPPPAAPERPVSAVTSNAPPLSLNELARRWNIWIGQFARRGQGPTLDLDALERLVKVTREGRSRVISVSATTPSPERAATIANRITQLYLDDQIELRRAYAIRKLEQVGRHVAELEIELQRPGAGQGSVQPTGQARETEVRLRQLERDAAAGELYANLQQREKEIRSQQNAILPDVRVLTLASPPARPSSSNPLLFIFPALVISLVFASLLAVVLERLDQGMRSARDVAEALDIPCLGLVPQSRLRKHTRIYRHLLNAPLTHYSEAIRSILATLQLAAPRGAATVVLFSSSVPKEGRTTLAISVATYAALIGRRVLLIDLDFRHPSILGELDVTAEKGVLDLMQPDESPSQVIQSVPELGFDFLPMLRGLADPVLATFFASERLPQLIRELRKRYDYVIIDGPPLLNVAETRLLAMVADKVLIAVKWGSTRRDIARNALALLRNSDGFGGGCIARSIAVLTQVNLKKHARYQFGDMGEMMMRKKKYHLSTRRI